MSGRLQKEIKQQKPFETLEQEVVLNVLRTATVLRQSTAELLRSRGLSGPQYNILRILRGAGPGGLACSEIAARLVTADPDVTRLLDRMEKVGLAARGRSAEDRRVVNAHITRKGLDLANDLDEPVMRRHREQLGHMQKKELKALLELLEKARLSSD